MIELAAVTIVAAITTTFALDILRPTVKMVMRRRPKAERIRTADAHVSAAH